MKIRINGQDIDINLAEVWSSRLRDIDDIKSDATAPLPPLPIFPDADPGEIPSYTWKTTRVEANPRKIDPKTAVLQAEPGPDGVFHVEGEELQEEELERLSLISKRWARKMQEDIDTLIRGVWGI